MDVAADIMEVQIEKLGLKESPPYSYLYDGYGMETMNYVNNSGSFFFYAFSLPTLVALRFIINLIALRYRKHEIARRIGMAVYSSNHYEFLMMGFKKIIIETFTDLSIMSLL